MARHFPGLANSFLRLSDSISAYPISFSFWLKSASFGTIPFFAGHENALGQYSSDYCAFQTTKIEATSFELSSFALAEASFAPTLNEWHHVLMVFASASSRKIWVNGSVYGENTTTISHSFAQDTLALGGALVASPAPTAAFPFSGDIADLGYWTTALNAADALALYNKTARPGSIESANLRGWWKLPESGDLNSTVAYLPFVAYGTVTTAADPPGLERAPFTIYENAYRDYLPFSRTAFRALDDPLHRHLKSAFPITEIGASRLDDPILGGSILPVPGSTSEPDGGMSITFSNHWQQYDKAAIAAPFLTISAWFKAPPSFSAQGIVYSLYSSGGYGFDLRVEPLSGGTKFKLEHTTNAAAIVSSVSTTSSIITTAYSNVTIVIRGDNYRAIYFNGRKEAESTASVPQAVPWNQFRLFDYSTAGLGYALQHCALRDLRMWSEVLTDNQIYEVYARGYARRDSEVVPRRQFSVILQLPEAPSGVSGVGAFAFTGYPAGLFGPLRGITGEPAAFNLAGQNALFVSGRGLVAGAGAYLIAEQPALLRAIRHLSSAAGAYDYDGKTADLQLIRRILADHGIFTYSGEDALIEITRMLDAGMGAFLLAGKPATFLYDVPTSSDFHSSLARLLYPEMLERERVTLFGEDATCTLYTVTPDAGEEVVIELDTGWSARRIPTIESGGTETWRLEITDDRVDWNMLKYVTKVRLRGATDEEQIYEISERYNAMKPGKVYHIHMQAICNFDPS